MVGLCRGVDRDVIDINTFAFRTQTNAVAVMNQRPYYVVAVLSTLLHTQPLPPCPCVGRAKGGTNGNIRGTARVCVSLLCTTVRDEYTGCTRELTLEWVAGDQNNHGIRGGRCRIIWRHSKLDLVTAGALYQNHTRERGTRKRWFCEHFLHIGHDYIDFKSIESSQIRGGKRESKRGQDTIE